MPQIMHPMGMGCTEIAPVILEIRVIWNKPRLFFYTGSSLPLAGMRKAILSRRCCTSLTVANGWLFAIYILQQHYDPLSQGPKCLRPVLLACLLIPHVLRKSMQFALGIGYFRQQMLFTTLLFVLVSSDIDWQPESKGKVLIHSRMNSLNTSF